MPELTLPNGVRTLVAVPTSATRKADDVGLAALADKDLEPAKTAA